jgi:tetratricopeptide (TPR) repeat protein
MWSVGLEEGAEASGCEAAVVHARVAEVQDLFMRGSHDGVVAASQRFAEDFPSGHGDWVAERAAYVLLLEGISLRQLGRGDEAVAAFGRLTSRFGDSPDPDVRDHVARGMINRAQVLEGLGRKEQALSTYNAVVERYREDPDARVGRRVSWAMWHKTTVLEGLDRDAEREALFDQLAHRHDEGVQANLDNNIAWCIRHRAWKLWAVGDYRGQVEAYDELVERFGSSPAQSIRRHVLEAMMDKASALKELGEDEFSPYDEIVSRFGAATEVEIRDGVVEALRRKGTALSQRGLDDDAITTFDTGLAILAEPACTQLTARAAEVLLSKGIALGAMGRVAEAVVVYDSTVATYLAADRAARTLESLVWVVMALTYKIENLCRLGRVGEADSTLDQLVRALGDIAEPLDGSGPPSASPNEDELARTFTELLVEGECWRFFDPPRRDASQEEMAERAVKLYRLTEHWVSNDGGELAVQAAAGFVRDIADGYALLAGRWSAAELARLPLPERAQARRAGLIRRFGIDEWLAEHGCAGVFEAAEEDAYDLPTRERDGGQQSDDAPAFWQFFLTTLHIYGLRLALCDSATGREILSNDNLRSLACGRLSLARRWVRWLGPEHELAPAAMVSLLVAEGFFLTSYGDPRSSEAIFPSKHLLREVLDDEDLRNQLEDENGALPAWLWDPAAESE